MLTDRLAGLYIQEYWHPDVGGEQAITFYTAERQAFELAEAFALSTFFFSLEDDLTAEQRLHHELPLQTVMPVQHFKAFWNACVAKVTSPPDIQLGVLQQAFSLVDVWNDRLYVAHGRGRYYAIEWSTTA